MAGLAHGRGCPQRYTDRRDLDNHVRPRLGQKQLTKIIPADLKDLYAHLLERGRRSRGRGAGSGLVRGIHTALHHALKTAVEEGLLPVNPADKVAPPKLPRNPKGILNNDQLDALMAAIRQDPLWHDFFYTELTTGLRRGELCGLKWKAFDGETGTLKICRTIHIKKGGGLSVGDTKTYAGTQTILLPHSTAQLLRARKRDALTE